MAAIGVALWKYTMRHVPHSPDFFNHDRFILSNGHTCLLQYTFLHLTGYKDVTFDQLKAYHSKRYDALCPGHPEIEHEGIEVTTGPLGQGISNAVGIAAAGKPLGVMSRDLTRSISIACCCPPALSSTHVCSPYSFNLEIISGWQAGSPPSCERQSQASSSRISSLRPSITLWRSSDVRNFFAPAWISPIR